MGQLTCRSITIKSITTIIHPHHFRLPAMTYALTSKSQVTVPKLIRQHLGVQPGQAVDYEPLPDGSVRMFAVKPAPADVSVFRKWRGTGVLKMSTDDIMRITRGDDWNR